MLLASGSSSCAKQAPGELLAAAQARNKESCSSLELPFYFGLSLSSFLPPSLAHSFPLSLSLSFPSFFLLSYSFNSSRFPLTLSYLTG